MAVRLRKTNEGAAGMDSSARPWYQPIADEVKYLFSGQGMPYEKVSILVAMVVTLVLGTMLGNNVARDARVAVIDLDNSAYTRELTNRIEASQYMEVTAVLSTPVDPTELFYQDRAIAVVYFPRDLEKSRYTGEAAHVGVFYDNTNTAQSAEIRAALNEIVGLDNAAASGDTGSTNDAIAGSIALAERNLFNPNGSNYNVETQGFLFFFGSMFFVFATIGMIPRLRMTHELSAILADGTPWDLVLRLVPYACCLIVSFVLGMGILHTVGDMTFSGSLLVFLFVQVLYVMAVGMMSLLFGWGAANPGIASSRMILFIPGGFIFGGPTGPIPVYPDWVVAISHFFPLTWEFHFVRDIVARGAGLADISHELGAFLLYLAAIGIVFCWKFYRERRAQVAQEEPAGSGGES